METIFVGQIDPEIIPGRVQLKSSVAGWFATATKTGMSVTDGVSTVNVTTSPAPPLNVKPQELVIRTINKLNQFPHKLYGMFTSEMFGEDSVWVEYLVGEETSYPMFMVVHSGVIKTEKACYYVDIVGVIPPAQNTPEGCETVRDIVKSFDIFWDVNV